jgi:hypothetical protein
MRTRAILLVFTFAVSILSHAESTPTTRRDEALRKAKACLHGHEASSRQCKNLNQNIQIPVDVYRRGDNSVLPTLLHFTYLTDFYDEALLSDPEGFLAAIKELPEKEQIQVAEGIAGGPFRSLEKERFEAVRKLLTGIPESSSTAHIAEVCLKALETNNASLFLNYFPPQTFTSRADNFQMFWYSRDLYSMAEKPLWPPSSSLQTTYRFTHLGAFTGPKTVSLTVLPDGTGSVRTKAMSVSHDALEIDDTVAVTPEKIARFSSALTKTDFWNMRPEEPSRGLDGAEWILEGVQNGKYHIVVRWCPAIESPSPQALAFADAARLLLEFAGHKYKGDC